MDDNTLIVPECAEIIPVQESTVRWYESITFDDARAFIRENIVSAARSFIAVGYYLRFVRDNMLYLQSDYQSVWDFADAEYGISKSTTSRYMTMNERFSLGGNSPYIAQEYKGFNRSQLQEMLYLTEEQLVQITPETQVKQIREIRRQEIPYVDIPGQFSIYDFPEALPDESTQEIAAEAILSTPSKTVLTIDDMIDAAGSQQNDDSIAISQQEGDAYSGSSDKDKEIIYFTAENQRTIDGAYGATCAAVVGEYLRRLHSSGLEPISEGKIAISFQSLGGDYIVQPGYDAEFWRNGILSFKVDWARLQSDYEYWYPKGSQKLEADEPMNGPEGDQSTDIELEKVIDAEFTQLPEQPDLPILKNNDQRAAFVDAYETWPLWIETVETGERYYRYNLPDGNSMVIKVYHAMLFDYEVTGGKWEDRFREGYGKHEYYLLHDDKFFRDCTVNKSYLVEYLKDMQKRKGQ